MPTDVPQSTMPIPPGMWQLDPNHSSISFKVRHIGLTNVRGRFNTFHATLFVGTSLAATRIDAVIDMSSVDTNQTDRDAHLRSTDFFSTEDHQEMVFYSTGVQAENDGYVVAGDLTINGVTRSVMLDVVFGGLQEFPMDGTTHAGFSATAEIARDDFGIDFNLPLGVDRFAVGNKVAIEIEAQFVAPPM